MGVATDGDSGFSFPKNLSVWWSEETEYVLQRIERWAAYARGYNRLRSVRLSPGRMTMQDEPENRWSISQGTNRLVVQNGWSPSFRGRRKQQQQQQQQQQQTNEQARLRCCALGNLDYKSNGNLESNVLEEYSLDHSIYFKTIGEIRNEIRPANKTTSTTDDTGTTITNNSASAKQPPLDCGDFLSSDFDELDDDEDVDFDDLAAVNYELREQLAANCNCEDDDEDDEDHLSHNDNSSGIIQVCRSVMDEDEINNNFTMMGFSRKFARPAAAQ